MKSRFPLASFAVLAIFIQPAHAAPSSTVRTIPKEKLKLVPDIKPDASPIEDVKNAIGARYRLEMSFNPHPIKDADGTGGPDGTYETYGTLTINDEKWWEMPRSTSNRGAQLIGNVFTPNNLPKNASDTGYSLTRSNAFNQGRKFEFESYVGDSASYGLNIKFNLFDSDNDPKSNDLSRDDKYGSFSEKIDLSKPNADYYWFWEDGNGNGSDFYVRVRRIGYIYPKPDGLTKPEVKPLIEKPKIITKGPGPVIRTAPLRK